MWGAPDPTDPVERLAREVARVADRLRGMPLARLAAALPPYESRALAARALAQRLADAAEALEAAAAGRPARAREVPVLADAAAADLVAVTGTDLVVAAGRADDETVRGVLAQAAEDCRALRLAL
ncbi:MAG: hypothetical protein R2737_03275 [Candidatus Nanopelagicales bacterium]